MSTFTERGLALQRALLHPYFCDRQPVLAETRSAEELLASSNLISDLEVCRAVVETPDRVSTCFDFSGGRQLHAVLDFRLAVYRAADRRLVVDGTTVDNMDREIEPRRFVLPDAGRNLLMTKKTGDFARATLAELEAEMAAA